MRRMAHKIADDRMNHLKVLIPKNICGRRALDDGSRRKSRENLRTKYKSMANNKEEP